MKNSVCLNAVFKFLAQPFRLKIGSFVFLRKIYLSTLLCHLNFFGEFLN